MSELVGGKLERVFDDQRAALSVVWRLGRETFSSVEKDLSEARRCIDGKLPYFKGYRSFPRSLLEFPCRPSEPTISYH